MTYIEISLVVSVLFIVLFAIIGGIKTYKKQKDYNDMRRKIGDIPPKKKRRRNK